MAVADSLASAALGLVGSTFAVDQVFIMLQDTFVPAFPDARPISLKVMESSEVMYHPLEDGSSITDHIIIEPVQLEIQIIFKNEYRSLFALMRQAFHAGTFLTVQTKVATYSNMVISEYPHEEDASHWDVLKCRLRLTEARVVQAQYSALSTKQRGAQQPTAASAADAARAKDAYGNSNNGSVLSKIFAK